MRICYLRAFVLFGALLVSRTASSADFPARNSETGFLEFELSTEFQSGPALVQVLAPDRLDPAKTYPVLFILPVEPAGKSAYGHGLEEARKADLANTLGVICVSPSFNKAAPWYGNHATNPNLRLADFMVRALVPYIDGHFPTRRDRDGRWLIGFSKSAWGAMTLLLRHPEIFGCAAGWDGPLMLDGTGDDWGPMGLSANFGTREAMGRNLPNQLVREQAPWLKQRTRLVLGPGIFWKGQMEKFGALLRAEGIPHVWRNDLAFEHRWDTGWFAPLAHELAGVARAPETKP